MHRSRADGPAASGLQRSEHQRDPGRAGAADQARRDRAGAAHGDARRAAVHRLLSDAGARAGPAHRVRAHRTSRTR